MTAKSGILPGRVMASLVDAARSAGGCPQGAGNSMVLNLKNRRVETFGWCSVRVAKDREKW